MHPVSIFIPPFNGGHALVHHTHACFAFISPPKISKIAIAQVNPIPTTGEAHKNAFRAICDDFEEFVEDGPLNICLEAIKAVQR